MSLESAVQENTEAIKALCLILAGAGDRLAKSADTPRGSTVAEAVKDAKAEIKAAADARGTKVIAAPEKSDTPPAAIDYEKDVKPLVLEKSKTNRDGVIAALASFGAKKGGDLKPEDFAAFKSKLEAL
jgi:hypothetical protein